MRCITVEEIADTPKEADNSIDEEEFKGVLAVRSQISAPTLSYALQANRHATTAIVDTGAQVSLMTRNQLDQLGQEIIGEDQLTSVKGINEQPLKIIGKAMLSLSCNNKMR